MSKNINRKHILKWKKAFCNAKANSGGANKGVVFEDFIDKLLEAIYGRNVWRRTKASHDNKRDFVRPFDAQLPETHWIECKNYSDNLSLNPISPTLVMSAIEGIDNIMFFSYSRLNDNAISNLNKYAVKQNKTITVYDGLSLESLIFKYRFNIPNIENYCTNIFDAQTELEFKDAGLIETSCYIADFDNKEIDIRSHRFGIDEEFFYVVKVHNLSPQNIIIHHIQIDLTEDTDIKYTPQSFPKDVALDTGTFYEYKMLCKVIKNDERIKKSKKNIMKKNLAKFNVLINGTNYSKSLIIKLTKFVYNDLIGERHLSAFDLGKNILLSDTIKRFLFISGSSGVGKTLLARKLMGDYEIAQKFNILYLNGEISITDIGQIISSFLVQSIGIIEDYTEQSGNDELVKQCFGTDDNNIETVLESIVLLSKNTELLLVVDNIDLLSNEVMVLLNNIVSYVQKHKLFGRFKFVLTRNRELFSLEEICQSINLYQDNYLDSIHNIEILPFNKKETGVYFLAKFGISNVESILPSDIDYYLPLTLSILSTYCIRNNIFLLNEKSQLYYMANPIDFSNRLRLLNESETNFYETITKDIAQKGPLLSPQINNIIAKLLLADCIDVSIDDSLNKKAIEVLNEYRLVTLENTCLRFSHGKIGLFYASTFQISDQQYKTTIAYLNKLLRNTEDFVHKTKKIICLLSMSNKKHNDNDLVFIKSYFTTPFLSMSVVDGTTLFNCLIELLRTDNLDIVEPLASIKFMQSHLKVMPNKTSRAAAIVLFKKFDDLFATREKLEKFSLAHNEIAYVFKKYLDSCLSSNLNQKCTELSKKYIGLLPCMSLDENTKTLYLSHFHNRMAVATGRSAGLEQFQSLMQNAEELHAVSREYSKNVQDPDLEFQMLIDQFNHHYIYLNDLSSRYISATKTSIIQYANNIEGKLKYYYFYFLLETMLDSKKALDLLEKFVEQEDALFDGKSSFYIAKIYFNLIYLYLKHEKYIDAKNKINAAYEHAYKYSLSKQVCFLNYAELILLIKENALPHIIAEKAESTYALFYNFFSTDENEFWRKAFIFKELLLIIKKYDKNSAAKLSGKNKITQAVFSHICEKEVDSNATFFIDKLGYFQIDKIKFPNL